MERVDEREWFEFQWPYLMQCLGGTERIQALAYQTGAFVRRRKIDSPEDLLRLLLMWTTAERSLMDVAAIAAETELGDVSDVALLKRFRKCGDWIGALLAEMLSARSSELPSDLRLRVLDASIITRPGRTGVDHRVHLGIDLRRHQIDSVELAGARAGESFNRFAFKPGEVAIGDRAYGSRSALSRLVEQDAFFVVRFAWPNLPLETRDGAPLDLFEALRSLPEAAPGEFKVQFRTPGGRAVPARLIAVRKSEPAAERARRETLRERKKHGQVDMRTLEATGYLFVLTNLGEEVTPDAVLELYRFRWQIEMKFKTLKSVLHLGNVPAKTDEMFRVYVLSKLLVAVLIDFFIEKADSFSPWGYPIAPHQQMATDPSPA